jgi:hypothetical protein
MLVAMTGLAHQYYIAPSYEQNNASNDDDDDDYHDDEIGNIMYRKLFYASNWVTTAQKQDRRCRCLR